MTQAVLFDVDPGCDDAVMLAMALGSPEVEVAGLTTVAGNSTVENTTRNALAVLEHLDRADVPVACGADRPLVDDLSTAEWVHGTGGLRGDLPDPTSTAVDRHAVSFILDTVREHGTDLTLVATGPLTNVAAALVREPALSELVSDLYVVGGAAGVPGNATPMAEANFHNDPVAARRVVQSATPRVVPLDALNHATVTQDLVDEFRDTGEPHATVASWLDYPEEVRSVGPTDDPIVHDAAVVAHLVADVLTVEPRYLDVDTSAGPSRGALVSDRYGVTDTDPNGRVAVGVDTDGFRRVLRESVGRL